MKDEHALEWQKIETRLQQEHYKKSGAAEKQQFLYMFDKWRMITIISNLKNGKEFGENLFQEMLEGF